MILITGGMGFIGLHTARCFLDAGESVVLTQYRARREPDFIKDEIGKRVVVESLDVSDATAVEALFRRHAITGVVHLAVPALGGLGPGEEFRVNVSGLLNVLEAASRANVRRVSLASSIAVYSGVAEGPFREETPLRMESGNATEAFKKTFEVLGLHYAAQTGLNLLALRIAGIYGPLYHSMANLPSRLCHAAVQGKEADLAGSRGGVPFEDDENDLCYVKDCARGIQLAHMASGLQHQIYNIGSGRATRVRELAAAVKAAVPDAKMAIRTGAGPQARPHASMELARIRQDAGYTAQYDVERGVADYVTWLRANAE